MPLSKSIWHYAIEAMKDSLIRLLFILATLTIIVALFSTAQS
jgi:hypothetical protein